MNNLDMLANDFKNWYTGNFNPETGKIRLYRYTDWYNGFDEVKSGESDILPLGYKVHGSEEKLIEALREYGKEDYITAIKDFKKGKLLTEFFKNNYEYAEVGAGQREAKKGNFIDPFLYWTTNGKENHWCSGRQYMIVIEIDPNEAQRRGGHEGETSMLDGCYETEWTIAGPVSKDAIVEIIDFNKGQSVYKKKAA